MSVRKIEEDLLTKKPIYIQKIGLKIFISITRFKKVV